MAPVQPSGRARLAGRALWLVTVSVVFGAGSGAVSVAAGLRCHSLGVLAVGLGVLADAAGSAALVWRFRAEIRRPGQAAGHEARAAVIVAAALGVISVALAVPSVAALGSRSRPGTSVLALTAAAVLLAVL